MPIAWRHNICSTSLTTGATSEAGIIYPFGTPEFTPRFLWDSRCSIFCYVCSVVQLIVCPLSYFRLVSVLYSWVLFIFGIILCLKCSFCMVQLVYVQNVIGALIYHFSHHSREWLKTHRKSQGFLCVELKVVSMKNLLSINIFK